MREIAKIQTWNVATLDYFNCQMFHSTVIKAKII